MALFPSGWDYFDLIIIICDPLSYL